MPHRIVLDIDAMDGPTERRTFDKPTVTVGRAPTNDIVVAARHRPGVHHAAVTNCSQRHGTLEVRGGALVLHDAGTSNGWHCLSTGMVRGSGFLAVGDSYYVGDTRITIVSVE
jgi:D-serine deaminase-like pyridoxal phosphate-dependent protein